jgi:hypothetical protein
MNILDDVFEMMMEQMRQIQLEMRDLRAELEKHRPKPGTWATQSNEYVANAGTHTRFQKGT